MSTMNSDPQIGSGNTSRRPGWRKIAAYGVGAAALLATGTLLMGVENVQEVGGRIVDALIPDIGPLFDSSAFFDGPVVAPQNGGDVMS